MELEATTEGGQDKWGRRYGASGMYALLSTIHNRDAILSSNRIESRVKVLLQKNNLIKGNKLFCHELKHVLLRLETETNDIPSPSPSSSSESLDVDEDWYSDSEDYLDDSKYNSSQMGSGGVEAAARARSESLLRSVQFSKRDRIVAPKSSDLLNIEKMANVEESIGLIGHEDNDDGVIHDDGEGGAEI
jgi:hypothetical protein